MVHCLRFYEPSHSENVGVLEARLVQAINQAASQTTPKLAHGLDAWHCNDENMVNICRKKLPTVKNSPQSSGTAP